MLNTNRTIVVTALKQLVREVYGNDDDGGLHDSGENDDNNIALEVDEDISILKSTDRVSQSEYFRLERGVKRMLHEKKSTTTATVTPTPAQAQAQKEVLSASRVLKRRLSSRASSFDSAPASPFRDNPLLVSHDYAKSPLVEGLEDSDPSIEVKEEGGEEIDDAIEAPSDNNHEEAQGDVKKEDEINYQAGDGEELKDIMDEKTEQSVEKSECCETTAENPSLKEDNSKEDGASEVKVSSSPATTGDANDFDPKKTELHEPLRFSPPDLLAILRNIDKEVEGCQAVVQEETEKRRRHKVDDCRRVHNYDEFITTFLAMLTEQGQLADLLEYGLNPKKKPTPGVPTGGAAGAASGSGTSAIPVSSAGGPTSSTAVVATSNVSNGSSGSSSAAQRRGRPKRRRR